MFGELGKNPSPRWDLNPRRMVGSNPIWGLDFFRVLQTFNLSCVCYPKYNQNQLTRTVVLEVFNAVALKY